MKDVLVLNDLLKMRLLNYSCLLPLQPSSLLGNNFQDKTKMSHSKKANKNLSVKQHTKKCAFQKAHILHQNDLKANFKPVKRE